MSTPGALTERLRPTLLSPDEAGALEVRGAQPAAVLVLLYIRERAPFTLFTRRRSDLRRHAGEISFPGGKRDPEDPDLLATALRETREEIGLVPDTATILGALQPVPTIATGYAVYPFVGLIEPDAVWRPSVEEVDEVIESPLAALLAGYGRRRILRRGLAIRSDTYLVGEHLIWGATARILADLFDRLAL